MHCPTVENLAGPEQAKRAAALARVNLLLAQAKRERAVKDHFQEGVFATLMLLTPEISREDYDRLMVDSAVAYAKRVCS